MVLNAIDERSAKLRAPFQLRPPALVAIAFLLGAPLPLIAADPSEAVHAASSALLVAIGFVLALSSLRRPKRLLSFEERVLRADDRLLPMSEAREIVLTGSGGVVEEVVDPTYRAEIVFESGHREVLLEYHEPARVLRDLATLLERLKLPVRRGWGLPEGISPWQSPGVTRASGRHLEGKVESIEIESPPSAGRPALAMIIGAVVLGTIQAILIGSALKRASPVSSLSIGLAVSSVLAVLLLGVMAWTRRIVVTADDRVSVHVRVLGVDVRTLGEANAPIAGAWPVSPQGRTPRHVLIGTGAGPLSVPCEGDAAAALVRSLTQHARNLKPRDGTPTTEKTA